MKYLRQQRAPAHPSLRRGSGRAAGLDLVLWKIVPRYLCCSLRIGKGYDD
jgi:hypothetical protein